MSIRCGACGRFIGHNEQFITDYEPSSHFGPEVIDFVHSRCAQVGRNAKRQDAAERLGPKDEHAVGNAETPETYDR